MPLKSVIVNVSKFCHYSAASQVFGFATKLMGRILQMCFYNDNTEWSKALYVTDHCHIASVCMEGGQVV